MINGKEEEFDSNKQYPRDAKFKFALNYAFAENNKPVAGGVTKATYTLPAELNVSNGSGSIEAKGYAGEAGTYTISNGVITFVYNTDFLSKHPTAIKGGFSFEGSVDEKSTTNKEKVDILFPGEGEGEKITIKFEDGKVSGSKSYQFNEDGTITFTVDLNVTGKDVTNVVLSDILGDNLEFANPPEFKLDKNDILNSKITGEGNKREVVLGDLPVGNHKVTYKVNVVNKNNTSPTRNTAKCKWNGGETPYISKEVSFVQKNLSKQGSADKSKNDIIWTVIYVPGQYTAAAGKQCTDTIGEGQIYSGNCDVYYDPNGNQWYVSNDNIIDSIPLDAKKNSFEYTFPDKCTALGGAYKLVYHTTPKDKLSELVSPKDYTNEVRVDGEDLTSEEKVSVAPDQAPSLNSSKTGEILNEDERIVKWTVTATPPDGKNVTDLNIKDELLENEKAKGKYINDSLVIKKGENDVLRPGTDYTVTTTTGQEDSLLITFLQKDISEKITVSYNVEYSASKDDRVSSVKNKATITYTIDGKPGSKEECGSVKFPEKTFSITKDGTITGNIIDWTIVVNNTYEHLWANLPKSAGTIVDTLPAGMEYVGDSVQCTIIPQYRYDLISHPQVKVTYDSAKRTLTFAVDEINGKIQAIIKYKTKLNGTLPSESDPGVEISDNKISYTNRVKVGDNEATKTIEITQKELTKTGKQSEKSKNVVEYTLGVNYMGDDLAEGSDTVQLEDVLDQDLIIDPGTLSVKDMNTGEDVSYQVSYNTTGVGRTKVTLTLPDQRALLVVYSAQLSSAGKTDGQSYEVKNNATLKGTSEKTVSNKTLVKYEKSAATVSGKVDSITIHKMGESSDNLSGAIFALSKVNPATLESESDKANCEKTTGENGLIVFDGLSMNTLYCYWEKQAPAEYQLDDTKHYFIIQNLSDNVRKKEYDDLIKSIKSNTDVASLTGGNVFTISNKKLTSISGEKIWDDADNQDGKRPESITVRLKANGNEIAHKTVTADESGNWTYSFDQLPKYADGKEIAYTVTEDAVDNYTTKVDGFTITNSYTPGKTSISVTKVWDDANNQDGLRPGSVKVQLYADGKASGTEVTLTADGNWTYTWENLNQKKAGKDIVYTVEEVGPVSGYTSAKSGDAEKGFTITNTHAPATTNVSGEKIWDDADNQDGKRPESITVRLKANGNEIAHKTVTADESGNWTYSFDQLPKYADGKEIAYTVTEDAVDNYTTKVDGFTITNSYTPGKTSISVTKVWDDANNQDGLRPGSVKVQLYADGKASGTEVTLTADGNWTYTWENLNQKKAGKDIVYTVEEVGPVSGYTSAKSGDAEKGFTITNTHAPATTNVSGEKIWDDADNQDGKRPESITVRLKANGNEIAHKTVTADESGNWTYSFDQLPKYADGKEIAYTVTEDAVDNYTTKVDGFTITNSYTPEKTIVSVSKSWSDDNNRDNKRPDSIEVKLVAKVDGSVIEGLSGRTQKLNSANGWKYTFADLAKYHAGKLVEYTVDEVNTPAGYTKTITGNATDGFNITNTYTPEKVQVSGSKNWNDDGNAAGTRPGSITIRLYANGSEIGHKTVTEKDGWSWNWTGLNRYDTDHKEISYTISEDAVDGYTSSISGYNVTNTVNKPQVGSVILTKVDATTGTALAGAVFDLYRANNTKVGTYTTNAGGVLRVDGLTFGDYYFVETKAPEGYALESQRAAFTINAATTVSAPASVRVTNRPVDEKIGVSAAKVWDDENNTDGVRPSSVTFRLFADGVEIGSAQASEANDWTVSFGNLPKTRNGVAISYAVKEDEVGNYYEASYENGLGSDGSYVFTVKNYRETDKHYEERTGSVRGANRNKPSNGGVAGAGRGRGTGDESDMTVYGTVSGASLLALIVWMIARRKRAGKGTK